MVHVTWKSPPETRCCLQPQRRCTQTDFANPTCHALYLVLPPSSSSIKLINLTDYTIQPQQGSSAPTAQQDINDTFRLSKPFSSVPSSSGISTFGPEDDPHETMPLSLRYSFLHVLHRRVSISCSTDSSPNAPKS